MSSTAFSDDQLRALQITGRFSSSLSFFGVASIIIFFLFNRKAAHNPTARLIIFMAIGDLMSAIAKFMGRAPVDDVGPDSALCQFQAALMQEGDLSSLTWTAILASNLLLVVFFKGRTDTIREREKLLAVFALGWPLIFAIVPVFLTGSSGRVYGDTTLWCWVKSPYKAYQILFFYAFLWGVFSFNLVAYLLVGRVIWKGADKFRQAHGGQQVQSLSKYRIAFARTALVYMTAFIIVWTPSNLNRFFFMSTGYNYYPFSFAQTLMSPMRGFVNFCAYFWIYWFQAAGRRNASAGTSGTLGKSSHSGHSGAIKASTAGKGTSNLSNLTELAIADGPSKMYLTPVPPPKGDKGGKESVGSVFPFSATLTASSLYPLSPTTPAPAVYPAAEASEAVRVSVADILDAWPRHCNWLILYDGRWEPLHAWAASNDGESVWFGFGEQKLALGGQDGVNGMHVSENAIVTLSNPDHS
ncbi:hypothetical protein DFS34DRAFT_132274 [Phlyctochytrium arcticum]|nr:hypothetical protein DFS34DRAFT_132274 [Phlyctochytrium arcticum]